MYSYFLIHVVVMAWISATGLVFESDVEGSGPVMRVVLSIGGARSDSAVMWVALLLYCAILSKT